MLSNKQKDKVKLLIESSRQVFQDCLLDNGAIVAAPCHMKYYPRNAKNYFYVWPGRDNSFNLSAALILGIDVVDNYLEWIWKRAESFQNASLIPGSEGLLFGSYYPNGRVKDKSFQLDQTASLLHFIAQYYESKKISNLGYKIIKKSTVNLINIWNKDHFNIINEDLWEERKTHPKFKSNFTYSLAACISGLKKASIFYNTAKLDRVIKEMEGVILQAYDKDSKYFVRRFGTDTSPDKNIDASNLSLLWPFSIVDAKDARFLNTLKAIENNIVDQYGVYRYQFDLYEGEIERQDFHYKHGAGAWPVLTFWMAIIYSKMGNKKKAYDYFLRVINNLDDSMLIPEQIFAKGDTRVGVKPLLWSHSMFILASKELGLLDL